MSTQQMSFVGYNILSISNEDTSYIRFELINNDPDNNFLTIYNVFLSYPLIEEISFERRDEELNITVWNYFFDQQKPKILIRYEKGYMIIAYREINYTSYNVEIE